MKKIKRIYCPYCGGHITRKKEIDVFREYCKICHQFFYDNPLPVVSTILVKDRQIVLVKRKNKPYKGLWCLPSGFAEVGESIEEAALRELEEEAGVKAKIIKFIDADSCTNYFYGDLIFLTFEVEQIGGTLKAGDDAMQVKYYPIEKIPKLAFNSNTRAVHTFIKNKMDYWAIVDSFTLSVGGEEINLDKKNFLSDKLIDVIVKNTKSIGRLWINDVTTNKSTPSYKQLDRERLLARFNSVTYKFSGWLGEESKSKDIKLHYQQLGRERKKEGVALSELISALSLARKHIWEFALSQGMWQKTIDIYITLELERRMMLFFDKAAYYISRGYENID